MNERDIFLAAIEIADPARRATYVAQACGADARLRAQVDQLLRTHEQAGPLLETPVVATNASTIQTIVTGANDADDDAGSDRNLGETEFRKCLQPTDRPGWLGRLAHYEVESILGRGAFGIVAKAFDTKLHRVVAIKLMHPELASTSPPRKRFLREARTAAAVTHENIVAIYAVEEEPIPYLVMEFIPGQTLQQRMDQNGPLEVAEVLRIGQQVASGLAAAHAVNLIHRDIKPSNILLSDGLSPRAKISDFGLARAIDDASLTSSGLIAGTPMYMAPEQARGETLDHRADLFSLGSVLYQVAGGRPPFRADSTLGVLKRVCEDTPRPLSDVLPGIPRWLETIIFRLLEKQRDDRYQTAQEVADLLTRCQRELEHNGKVTCVAERSNAPESKFLVADALTDTGAKKWPIGWLVGGFMSVAALTWLALMNGQKPTSDSGLTVSSADTTSASTSAVRSVLANSATVRQLPEGRFEVVARDYHAVIGATGLIEEVSSGETTLVEATSFGGMGRAESGPVTAMQEGTTLTFSQGDEYRLTYAFRPDGYTILARVSTAAAGRDGIDGKQFYLPHISRFSASAQRVVPEDGLPPFDLPATKEEESYTCRFVVEFDSGAQIEVHSAPGEHSGFIFPGGPMAWGRVNLQLDTDNELRFDIRR